MQKLGYTVKDIKSPEDILAAKKLVFPGVGAYGSAMDILRERKLIEPLREYVLDGTKPFMGVLGLTVIVRWERRVWRSGRFGFDSRDGD